MARDPKPSSYSSSASTVCPCSVRESDPQDYAECCRPWHAGFAGGVHAPTAQALMRSRYSAYALAKRNDALGHAMLQYLHDTWHTSTVPGEIELGPIQWTGLEVLQAQESTDVAVVEFIAHFKENGKAGKMQELSRFIRVDKVWKYIDGDVSEGG